MKDTEQSTQVIRERNIHPRSLIRIPDTDVYIAKRQKHYGGFWEESHYALAENGLFMPPPALFFSHLANVRNASEGKLVLYDGEDNPISQAELEELRGYLHSNYVGGVRVYLDACFVEGRGHLDLDLETDHHPVIEGGIRTLVGKRNPLEFVVSVDFGYVTFDLNNQGLPTKRSWTNYAPSRNMMFRYPRKNHVVRYSSCSCYEHLYDPNDIFPNESLRIARLDCCVNKKSIPPEDIDIKDYIGVLACVHEDVLKKHAQESCTRGRQTP